MRSNKKNFLKAIVIVKEFGFCPVCYTKGKITKFSSNSFHCSACSCISTFERDKLIMGWYIIKNGVRKLMSAEISSSKPRWKSMLEEAQNLKRKGYGRH